MSQNNMQRLLQRLDREAPDVAAALRRMERANFSEALIWLTMVNKPLELAVRYQLKTLLGFEGPQQTHFDGLQVVLNLVLALRAALADVTQSGMAIGLAEPELTMPLEGQAAECEEAVRAWIQAVGRRRPENRNPAPKGVDEQS
jgi:hypothetical protein